MTSLTQSVKLDNSFRFFNCFPSFFSDFIINSHGLWCSANAADSGLFIDLKYYSVCDGSCADDVDTKVFCSHCLCNTIQKYKVTIIDLMGNQSCCSTF